MSQPTGGWVDFPVENIVLGEPMDPNYPPLRMRKLADGTVDMQGGLTGPRVMLRLPDGFRPDPEHLPPHKQELMCPRFDEGGDLVSARGIFHTAFFELDGDVYMAVWQVLRDVAF